MGVYVRMMGCVYMCVCVLKVDKGKGNSAKAYLS